MSPGWTVVVLVGAVGIELLFNFAKSRVFAVLPTASQMNWSQIPMCFDVPASTQIFGRIVLDAGIEGILYDSVLTHTLCSAIYPQNFQNSSAYIELDDPCPPGNTHK